MENAAKKIKKIGIIGTGTMGATIAKICSEKGLETILYGRSDQSFERAKKIIGEEALKLMKTTTDLKDLSDCDLINESIPENIQVKTEFFSKISEIVRPDTILTTNTSSLPINALAKAVKGKERFLGMHWFNPANVIPLVEIVYCNETSEENGKSVYQLALDLGKKPVFCKKDLPGFIANRIQAAIFRECIDIVEQGAATPEDIDNVMKYGLGFRLAANGPFEIADFGGIDVFYYASKQLYSQICDKKEPQKFCKDIFEAGRYGVKNGHGIYDYPGDKAKKAVGVMLKKYDDMKKINEKWEQEFNPK